MCGLAGYKNISNQNSSIEQNILDTMQQSIMHRGPDDFGTWKSDEHQIGFAYRRLSIIDLSPAGAQPMWNTEGSVVIMFNGEIYNHQELRYQLEAMGFIYTSRSDTETLLHAYEAWGIQFLHKLEGMFAISLYDLKTRSLYLIRDHIGVKPLYFSTQGGYLSFASEIKALWCLPWMKKEICPQALYHYLSFMVAPAPYTIFKEIYKLPAGFYAHLDAKKNLSFHEWYSPLTTISDAEKKQFELEEFCVENIRSMLQESIKRQMMSDVPFGAFLSGGIDSSLNVALMARAIGKVKTFTVAFSDGPETNELLWARRVAKEFNTDHHEIIISEKEAFGFYEKMVFHLDEPLADSVCIPFYFVAKLAKESGVTVVQVGEGSDELFFGYDLYAQYVKLNQNFWQPTNYIPKTLRKVCNFAAQPLLKNHSYAQNLMHNWARKNNLFWGGAIAFHEQEKLGLHKQALFDYSPHEDPIVKKIYSGLRQNFDSHSIVDFHLKNLHKHDPLADFMKQMTYLELKQRLPELLLMRADKMAMAASVEGRVPFLNHKLVEFALHIPSHLKFKNQTTKYILKKVCEGVLPHEIIYRKKVGFAAPIVRWMNHTTFFKNMQSTPNLPLTYSKTTHIAAVQKWTIQNYEEILL